jgi:lipoprotein-anchoring transpeptidase ErfK/SrfK
MKDVWIRISIAGQRLELLEGARVVAEYAVSTSRYGVGEEEGSEKTPRGRHRVAEKIGEGAAEGAVFVGRRPTGEICTRDLVSRAPGRDWILSRILWLEGLEEGRNRGGSVDSHDRYIYIHGTPEEDAIGHPASHGCVRMRNADVVALFDRVEAGTFVVIQDQE